MTDEVSLLALIRLFRERRVEVFIGPYLRKDVIEIKRIEDDDKPSENNFILYNLATQTIMQNTCGEWSDLITDHRIAGFKSHVS